ncbi:MAG: hypothetical protein IH845_01065 [Nanoarchaeota archaeon]|nr:hypothetical protein [Nanoarchaeota archaeon]
MKETISKGRISPLVPKIGGGLSMEAHLVELGNKKYVVRICKSKQQAKFYESISRRLSKYKILPKFIERQNSNVFFEYLPGRDLKNKENLKIFEQIGSICARINNLEYSSKEDINSSFNKQLSELTNGKYRKYTLQETEEKRARRPSERHDIRRIKALITKEENKKLRTINKKLITKTKIKVSLDAFDVSPANFRLSNGKVYFVDMDAIKPKIKGIGIAKCFFKWAKNDKQKKAFLNGYLSILENNFLTEEYMDLLYLHFLVQALHDRAKLGRNYKEEYKALKGLLRKF